MSSSSPSTPLKCFGMNTNNSACTSPLSGQDSEMDIAMECAAMAFSFLDTEEPPMSTPVKRKVDGVHSVYTFCDEVKRRRINDASSSNTTSTTMSHNIRTTRISSNEGDIILRNLECALKKLRFAAQQSKIRLPLHYCAVTTATSTPIVYFSELYQNDSQINTLNDNADNTTDASIQTVFRELCNVAIQRSIQISVGNTDTFTPIPYLACVSSSGYNRKLHAFIANDDDRIQYESDVENKCRGTYYDELSPSSSPEYLVDVISFGRYDVRSPKVQVLDAMLVPIGYQSRFRYAHAIPLDALIKHDATLCDAAATGSSERYQLYDNNCWQYRYFMCEYTSVILPNNVYQVCANNAVVAESDHPRKCWMQALNLSDEDSSPLNPPKGMPFVVTRAIAPLKMCIAVLNRMVATKECKHFLFLFTDMSLYSKQECPEIDEVVYQEIIKRPTSLSCVYEKLAKFEYMTAYEFAFDMRLVFYNAQVYFPVDSEEFHHASRALEIFDFIFGCWIINNDAFGSGGFDGSPKLGPWDSWRNPLSVFVGTEQHYCACCRINKKTENNLPLCQLSSDMNVESFEFISCTFCLERFHVPCIHSIVEQQKKKLNPKDPHFVCNRCSIIQADSLSDVMPKQSSCMYWDFYFQTPKLTENKARDSFTGFFWRPLVRLSYSKASSFINNIGTTGLHGWFERISVINGMEQNMKQNKSKYKYLSPSGIVYSTQADMHRAASAETEYLANSFYLGTSFKRRRFRNKSHKNLIRKMKALVPGKIHFTSTSCTNTTESKTKMKSMSPEQYLVQSRYDLPFDFRRNRQYPIVNADNLPPDGFFGLSNIGVRLRIEGFISKEFEKYEKSKACFDAFALNYVPVEVAHLIQLIKKVDEEKDSSHRNSNDNTEKCSQMDYIDSSLMRLRNYLLQKVIRESFDFAHDSLITESRFKVKLPVPEPLSTSSAAYSLIPGSLMTEVLTIWQFFQDFGEYIGFETISFSDTCQSCTVSTYSSALIFPSIYQLMYDEMATCLTRILLLDLRTVCNELDSEGYLWSKVQAKYPINVITWPEIAHRCIISQLYVDSKTDASYYVSFLLKKSIFYKPPNLVSEQIKKMHHSVNHLLEGNPECWSTEIRIAILALLVEKALQTTDLCRIIEDKRIKNEDFEKRLTKEKLVRDELTNRKRNIVKPSINFAINSHSSDATILNMLTDDHASNIDDKDIFVNNAIYDAPEDDLRSKVSMIKEIDIPILRCPLDADISKTELEKRFGHYCDILNLKFSPKQRQFVCCDACGLRLDNNGILLTYESALNNGVKVSQSPDDTVFLPVINQGRRGSVPERELRAFHKTCAKSVFACQYISETFREKLLKSVIEGKVTQSTAFYQSMINSFPNMFSSRLGFDDEGNVYFTLGERRDVVFRRRVKCGYGTCWGVYVGQKKLKSLLYSLTYRRPLSRNEGNLRMAILIRCNLCDVSISRPLQHPLFQSRLKVLQREYEKSDEKLNYITQEELKDRSLNRFAVTEFEKWKINMQTAISWKCIELRSTSYDLRKFQNMKKSKGNEKCQVSSETNLSRLRLRIKISRYEGDEFVIRHGISQTLREIRAQTIAHRLLLNPVWNKSRVLLQHKPETGGNAYLPFLDNNFDNLLAIPRLSWDLGFKEDNKSLDGHGEVITHRSLKNLDLLSLPIVRYAGLDDTPDAVYPNIYIAAKILYSQVEQLLYQQDREHAVFLSGKVAGLSRTAAEHRQAIQHLYDTINESRKIRCQDRLVSQSNGYSLDTLIIASALGYLGSRVIHGFRFEFASYVNGKDTTCITLPTFNRRTVLLKVPPMSYFEPLIASNEAIYKSHEKLFQSFKTEAKRSKNVIEAPEPLLTSSEGDVSCKLKNHTEHMLNYQPVVVSVRIKDFRFEKVKAELWNICECLPRNSSSSGFYFIHARVRCTESRGVENQHDNTLYHGAWAASLKTATTPLDLLYCLNSLVSALPPYWYARSFRLDELSSLIDLYEQNNGPVCESVAPVAVMIYRLDKSIGLNSEFYGPWGNSKKLLGADLGQGYRSLPKKSHSPVRVAGGSVLPTRQCTSSILCSKKARHSGPCNDNAIQEAENYLFPRPSVRTFNKPPYYE